MADISKQIDEGQVKWGKGVDLSSMEDINAYVKFKTFEYGYYKFTNDDLWEQYREDFVGFMEAIFKTCSIPDLCNLRALLCKQGVWVAKDKWTIIARSLYDTLYEKDQTEWTKEEILDHIRESGPFISFKLNRISGIVAEALDQIRD
jgi:hypothetical protein